MDYISVPYQFGPLIEIWMARSVPCFAFVVFKRKEDAFEACRAADGQVGSFIYINNTTDL